MVKKKRKVVARVLSDETIDRYFAQAAATVKEVEESLRPAFTIPASTRGLVIR